VVEGGIKLDLEVWEPLPALEADARKLKQVLVNLLTNAVKFTESGGVVTVRVWHREDSGIVVQIADTGIGMAAGDIPKALARFGQVDSRLERRHEGTGLGLPLAKALIELHGGSLDLQSRPGLGTTVTLRLPASRAVAHGGHGELVAAQAS
jgi:signal transduction histidine kinase